MKKFLCHKVVSAFLVGEILGNVVHSLDGLSDPVEVPNDFFDRHDMNNECYLVKYEDDYLSVSPKDVFEAGYTEMPDRESEYAKRFPILRLFAYSHLPKHLQLVSKPFHDLAWSLPIEGRDPAEIGAALRKLREAKDCAVTSLV